MSLIRNAKKHFYENLNSRKFWKQVKHFFSNKTLDCSTITHLKGNQIINDNLASVEILNNYFIDAVEDLDIDRGLHISNTGNTLTPVDKCIEMYRGHPCILKTNEIGYNVNAFSFKPVCIELINRLINNIDSSKAYQKGNIPPNILKDNVDMCPNHSFGH